MPYRIIHGSTQGLPDATQFLETLNTLGQHSNPQLRTFFEPDRALIVTRAPGRMDVMGGFADYSGSLVLEMPIREAVLVALQRDDSEQLQIISLGDRAGARHFRMPLSDFDHGEGCIDYAEAGRYFNRDADQRWAGYVAGAFLALRRECGIRFGGGARILIDSSVPEGKGVSSSAALEVAVMQAIAAAFEISLPSRDLALLCQRVENLIVGAPCGVMDQITVTSGQAKRLLALLCQPAEITDFVAIPEEIGLWGLDSGERHAISGVDYASVRAGAFMGYRIIADLANLSVEIDPENGRAAIQDPAWHGYLANLPGDLFTRRFASHLPVRLTGGQFLQRYGNTSDPVTTIDADFDYAIRNPTAHPIHEHERVRAFAHLLRAVTVEKNLVVMGELMVRSHESYTACGLGSPGTNRLVDLARKAGPARGIYAAKITGGGSGGTVIVLGRRESEGEIAEIAGQYALETGHEPYLFTGSSPGAAGFGHLRLQPDSQSVSGP